MKWRSAWPIFHGSVILPYILKTIWFESVWPDVWPKKNKCRSLWPIFHGPMILPYFLKTIWCMNYLKLWVSMAQSLHLKKCKSLWPIFHSPVTLCYILKTFWCMIILWDYGSEWPDIWPRINVGHCDLYFMVQWYCYIQDYLMDECHIFR